MADVEPGVAIEEIGEHAAAAERARRERRDELLRRPGHHDSHRCSALAEPADQVERFVRGDPSRNNQKDRCPGETARRLADLRRRFHNSCGAG